jgi:phosphoglycolate phosphatase
MDDGQPKRLLLFDIDGTLIRSAGAGRAAMDIAFEQVFNIPCGFDGIQMMGRTDPGILQEAFDNHGLTWDNARVEIFKDTYFRKLEEGLAEPRDGKYVCPGIVEILNQLQNNPNIVIGLLTGNWRSSGYAKLVYFGIDHYFVLGAFADDSADRSKLVPVAMRRFEELYTHPVARDDVFVIGDTPLDIIGARPHDVKTVAVATGFHATDQLMPESPDFLFEDFSDVPRVMAVLQS